MFILLFVIIKLCGLSIVDYYPSLEWVLPLSDASWWWLIAFLMADNYLLSLVRGHSFVRVKLER